MKSRKAAVVTGANRGLGLAFCDFLAQSSYEVHAICRRSSPALNACASFIYEDVDLAHHDSHLGQRIKASSIDLLINNAGVGHDDFIQSVDLEEVKRHFIVNAYGALWITLALLNKMQAEIKLLWLVVVLVLLLAIVLVKIMLIECRRRP